MREISLRLFQSHGCHVHASQCKPAIYKYTLGRIAAQLPQKKPVHCIALLDALAILFATDWILTHNPSAGVDDARKVTLVNVELHCMRLRQMLRRYLHPSPQVTQAVC